MKKFSMQALDSERSVCMGAVCYSGPMSAIPTNGQLLGKKRIGAKFQRKTEGLVCIYTDG